MSNFTIKLPQTPILVTLSDEMNGQVDIKVRDLDGHDYRVASFYAGKLHLFKFNTVVAKNIGLELDANQYSIITRV